MALLRLLVNSGKNCYIFDMKKMPIAVFTFSLLLVFSSCGQSDSSGFSVGVFVPGFIEGSPTYELMASGVQRAVDERPGTNLVFIEAGFNQSQWEESMMTMAASGQHDIIVSSNPAMPDIVRRVLEEHPQQHFLLLDAEMPGEKTVHSVAYSHFEQGFLNGYAAGLISKSNMQNANEGVRVGLIAGQEYPAMNTQIKAGFISGARQANPRASLDFRVVGSWNDPAKAAELSRSMISNGADVILTICGGGNQGVIATAREAGAYVSWFDISGYDYAPDVIVASTYVLQDTAVYDTLLKAIDGELTFGESETFGVKEGYIGFDYSHPVFVKNVPGDIREAIISMEQHLRGDK